MENDNTKENQSDPGHAGIISHSESRKVSFVKLREILVRDPRMGPLNTKKLGILTDHPFNTWYPKIGYIEPPLSGSSRLVICDVVDNIAVNSYLCQIRE
jgi:hypothetical protein